MKKEFVSAPRMDNQVSCHIGIEAFTELFKTPDYQKEDSDLSFFIMFDNEEVSTSVYINKCRLVQSQCKERTAIWCQM